MSVNGAAARLNDIDKRLRRHWVEIRLHWRDDNALQFEEEIIEPLLIRIRNAEHALGELSGVLQQVRRDCE